MRSNRHSAATSKLLWVHPALSVLVGNKVSTARCRRSNHKAEIACNRSHTQIKVVVVSIGSFGRGKTALGNRPAILDVAEHPAPDVLILCTQRELLESRDSLKVDVC